MAMIRKQLQHHNNYYLYKYFLYYQNADYGKEFVDFLSTDNFMTLSFGCFWWLINIKPGHLVFCLEDICFIELYYPSYFS